MVQPFAAASGTGDFAAGWVEYEHRWGLAHVAKLDLAQPLWSGERLDGKTILLWSEQGFGDAIQFLRYVPLVAARGGRIVLRVERPLVRLAASLPGDMMIVSPGQRLPEFNVWCPLLSVPRILETRLETIPRTVPYLGMRPALAERWRQRLAGLAGWRVGLAWAGDPRHVNDFRRSTGLQRLMPLLAVPASAGSACRPVRAPPISPRLVPRRFSMFHAGRTVWLPS